MNKIVKSTLLFIFLTILTQIGGIVYIFTKVCIRSCNVKLFQRFVLYTIVYLVVSTFIVPSIAKRFGREPLPIFSSKETPITPLRIITCLANRHYVRTALKTEIIRIAKAINTEYPNSTITYLDGNFPFLNGFSLLPHLSHKDGKKLDIAFFYQNTKGENLNDASPSIIGYGVCEEPKSGEYNYPKICADCGNDFKHNYLRKITPQFRKAEFIFDENRNREFLRLCANNSLITKIYLEPHLTNRLGLQNIKKIHKTGCNAVRHDDHIHIQL